MKRQRRITPPVYNERRLNEKPIPRIDATSTDVNDSIDDVETQSNGGHIDQGNECVHDGQSPIDSFNDDDNEEDENMIDIMPSAETASLVDPLQIKPEDSLVVINSAVDGDIDGSADCCYEVIDDDITVYYDDISSFKAAVCKIQIKRNDIFSGTLPYKEYVSEKIESCITYISCITYM